MKFLIAGFGSIGRRHFRNLKALGERDILFHRSGNSQLDDKELAGYTVERDMTTALAHKPDAVIVANPTALHLDIAIPSAKARSHLFLEKPISHSLERLDELEAAVKASRSRVLVGFQFRFHPGLQKAAQLLMSGKLGRPLSARAHWGSFLPNWHPWEDYRQGYSARANLGGGVLLTLCHPFDYLRWLLGDVNSVWGSVIKSGELDIDVEDQAEVGLEFANGALGSVHLDYLQRPGAHWLEVICSKGVIHWDAESGSLQVTDSEGNQQEHPVSAGFERNDLFLEQMKHFIDVVSNKAESSCTLDDGRQALEIVLAAHAAAAQGKKIDLKG